MRCSLSQLRSSFEKWRVTEMTVLRKTQLNFSNACSADKNWWIFKFKNSHFASCCRMGFAPPNTRFAHFLVWLSVFSYFVCFWVICAPTMRMVYSPKGKHQHRGTFGVTEVTINNSKLNQDLKQMYFLTVTRVTKVCSKTLFQRPAV